MPRNSLDINTYVQHLLSNNLTEISVVNQQVAYGYPGKRRVYEDPLLAGKQVVVVAHSTEQPNVISEANNYIANLAAAAKSLIDNDEQEDKALRKKALDKLAKKFRQHIKDDIDSQKATGNLFDSITSRTNKNFLAQFDKARKILVLYTQALSKITGHPLNTLEDAGHQLRSQNRATLIHRFRAPKAKEGEEQFIMYIPCGRYTKRQQELMGKPNSANRDHDTTSHNRANLVLGNSSMARMVAGTRHADGTVTLVHDSFTGPGARMPYSDFKGADSYKKLALKAITLINQEEIIQALAQRQIDRMSDEELWENIEQHFVHEGLVPSNKREMRKLFVEAYLNSPNIHLAVTECYTQVVTAGQKVAAENQHEQFQYVRQMMDAFDGARVNVTIQTDEDNEVEVGVNYQARMGSWGVNWFRKVGKHNPLADNSVTQKQNARFINQMTRDVIVHLAPLKDEADFQESQHLSPLYELLRNPDVQSGEAEIGQAQAELQQEKAEYREALFAYFEEYNKGERNWGDRTTLEQLKLNVEGLENSIKAKEKEIYGKHVRIERIRKEYYFSNKIAIQATLSQLKEEIEPYLEYVDADPKIKAKLQHFYNCCAYLFHAQELYYEDSWHKDKNNFKLQTLMASLAEELGYANTKGCKSNNDRGQRLAQKIVGNALWTKMSDTGLYTREFLDQPRTQKAKVGDINALDRQLTTIQALHHTANTGVSGGKFTVDKTHFADNGLYGRVADLAKVKDMHADNAITKNLKWKLRLSGGAGLIIAGLALVLGLFFPPATLFIAGTGLSLAGFTAATMVIVFLGSLTLSTLLTLIQNKLYDSKIQDVVDESFDSARQELTAVRRTNSDDLHHRLGVHSIPTSSSSDIAEPVPPQEQHNSSVVIADDEEHTKRGFGYSK